MKLFPSNLYKIIFGSVLGAALAGITSFAHAGSRALIMSIDYVGSPKIEERFYLPFTNNDADDAIKIAHSMGIPDGNITQYKNERLDSDGFKRAIKRFSDSVERGDQVFIYYSGHGMQINGRYGSKCTEGMVTYDADLYDDGMLNDALEQISQKAAQVVMFNDSCFSGGAATKDISGPKNAKAKLYTGKLKGTSKETDPESCGAPVNKAMNSMKSWSDDAGKNVLYIAASANNEVSYGNAQGSFATHAWANCLVKPGTDSDQSGRLTGDELASCARTELKTIAPDIRQTITLVGNTALPLSFSMQAQASSSAPIDAVQALQDISHGADTSYHVRLSPAKTTLTIEQDFLEFSVSTEKPGYLYVFQVGSDGETFNLLYPNAHDGQDGTNRVDAGTIHLPHGSWRLRSAGPEGTSHLLAYVSPTPRTFLDSKNLRQTFRSSPAKASTTRNLDVEASKSDSSESSEYGASAVVDIREVR